MDVQPVAHAFGRGLRAETRAPSARRRQLLYQEAQHHRSIGGHQRRRRPPGHLELVDAVLRQEHLRFQPGLVEQRHQGRAKGIGAPHRRQAERGSGRPAGPEQLEFLLEGDRKREPRRLERCHRLLQQAARAAFPGRAVQLRDVGEIEMQRRRAHALQPQPCRRIGQQPEIARRAPGVALGDDVEGGQRHVRRHPTAAARHEVIFHPGHGAAPARDRDEIGGEYRDQLGHSQPPSARSRASTVSVSVTQQ